jgi:hypothetical protein
VPYSAVEGMQATATSISPTGGRVLEFELSALPPDHPLLLSVMSPHRSRLLHLGALRRPDGPVARIRLGNPGQLYQGVARVPFAALSAFPFASRGCD